ncbi:MAG: hypothetical protein ACFCBW_13355 [Candidatus Competibacterales bacterium]
MTLLSSCTRQATKLVLATLAIWLFAASVEQWLTAVPNPSDTPLPPDEIIDRLQAEGFTPIWQLELQGSFYVGRGVDARGNPVTFQVEPLTAEILQVQPLAFIADKAL